MTFFLHDHFATSVLGSNEPDSGHLVRQNQTFRQRALGNFRPLCEELTVDPAMLYWLNGSVNVHGTTERELRPGVLRAVHPRARRPRSTPRPTSASPRVP